MSLRATDPRTYDYSRESKDRARQRSAPSWRRPVFVRKWSVIRNGARLAAIRFDQRVRCLRVDRPVVVQAGGVGGRKVVVRGPRAVVGHVLGILARAVIRGARARRSVRAVLRCGSWRCGACARLRALQGLESGSRRVEVVRIKVEVALEVAEIPEPLKHTGRRTHGIYAANLALDRAS